MINANHLTRVVFPRSASAEEMAASIQRIRQARRTAAMAANQHAEKAKELLVHHIREAGGSGDPQEIESIIDEILAAVHLEIERELKAVFDGLWEGRKAAEQLQKDRPA